jgi:multiple sugar transport system permease protein
VTTTPEAAQAIEEQLDDGTADIARQRHTDAKKAERKLGMMLVAPAVVLMLVVTAYPILYALWLSLNKADLRRSASLCSSRWSARSSSWCSACCSRS